MFTYPVHRLLLVVLTCLVLAGCKSDAERADEYFRSGMELLEQGDTDRAMVEFRNVFQFDENHLETRLAMGRLFLDQNNPGAAYGQFLRVAEQYPDEFEPRPILAELAFASGNWDEFVRHGTVAVQMRPEDTRVQAIDLGLKYREAVLAKDDPARAALTAPAEALLVSLPESPIINTMLIDTYVRDGALTRALERIDVMLESDPTDRALNNRRLALLAQMQEETEFEKQLRQMVERFPGDQEVQEMLLRYYVSEQRLDDAEAFLREISDPADEDPALFLSLIQFVREVRGLDAARAEIQRAIAENPNPERFRAMLAMMDFQAGEQNAAIAEMENILEGADLTEDSFQGIQTTLARMFVSTGNEVGGRRLVEEVLAQNPSHVEALKMQASWQLQADEVDQAIANLRIALDTAPEDVQAMNLMSEAYVRLGDTNLARDYLARAVEASGNAPETTLRYARVLMDEERYLPAEDVLLPALQQSPGNVDLLTMLGRLYLAMEDIPRARQVIDTLNRIDTEQSHAIANELQAEVLNREGGTEEAIAFLERLATGDNAGLREQVMLLRARLQVGEAEEALALAEEMVANNPDNLSLKQALASTQAANGDLEAAAVTLQEITGAAPGAHQPWLQRSRIARLLGNEAEATALVEEALEATGRHPDILWAKASMLEQNGDIDGAIAIYEDLYEQNSGSVIIANNLASLLATYRDDAESLERAWVVGRRLQGAENPALQDTYGWLLYRRGEHEAALPYLERAAAELDDPIVEAHLGFAYAALGRNADALDHLQRAVDLAGPADTRERIEAARAEISRLRSLPEN